MDRRRCYNIQINTFKMKNWKTLSSELAFDNKWFNVQKDVVQLPNGKIIDDYFLWREPNVAQVVAFTKKNKIILVKQYKHGAGCVMIECPAGYVEDNESFEDAARREFLEETGYKISGLEYIHKIAHNPTKSTGIVKLFLVKNVKKTSKQKLDEYENIEILEVDIPIVLKMINDGEIWATGTISAIFLALKKIGYKI